MEVLHPLNIGEGSPLPSLLVGDEAAGDASHRPLNGHTRVHQSQGRATDRALGGGAIGGQNLGNHTDGVGELLHRGDHRQQRLLRQCAMANLPAGGGAGRLCLASRESGEVIVVNIPLGFFRIDCIQLLGGR